MNELKKRLTTPHHQNPAELTHFGSGEYYSITWIGHAQQIGDSGHFDTVVGIRLQIGHFVLERTVWMELSGWYIGQLFTKW